MKKFNLILIVLMTYNLALAGDSPTLDKTVTAKDDKKIGKEVFFLSPESPLNQESLDLNQPLFIGETSLGFSLRNPLDGTSGGNSCSSCSH